tara:strand:+ start:665 stop:892 length:228 start_codon:yes stop_codon:yes gene_type:complete
MLLFIFCIANFSKGKFEVEKGEAIEKVVKEERTKALKNLSRKVDNIQEKVDKVKKKMKDNMKVIKITIFFSGKCI